MKHEYGGNLTVYYETGMETLGLILQDARGITPNPQYDPSKTGYPFDIPEWYSLSHAVFFQGNEEIEVLQADGSVEYRGLLTKDRKAIALKNYRYAFLPKEILFETWIKWFVERRKARVWSEEAPLIERHPDRFER